MLQAVLASSAELRPIAQNPASSSRQPVALRRRVDLQPPYLPSAAKTANRASRRPSSRPRRRTADLPRRCGRTTTTLLRRNLPKILSLPQQPQQFIGSRAVEMWTTLKKRCPHCPQPQQMQCQPGTHINQDSAAPHRIPEATSSASAEPGHPQILPRRQTQTWQVGTVGYFYQQLTADKGCAP